MTRIPKALEAFGLVLAAMFSSGIAAEAPDMAPSGPLGAVLEHDPSIAPAFTVYRPRDMASVSGIPVVVWGNGACAADGGAAARRFLLEIASHGYLIVALGKPGADPGLLPTTNRDPSPRLPPVAPGNDETAASELTAAIDWALSEHERPGSILRGRLAKTKVAVMGHSCGGLQALSIQGDPRVRASLIWNSGIYERPAGRIGVRPTKAVLKSIHAPILYVQGGPTDIAYEAVNDDFARLPPTVPALLVESNVGHSGTFSQRHGGAYAVLGRAWLDYWLKGDAGAGRLFSGPACVLCRDPDWKVMRRGLD